jgi:hypothetical protein
VVPQRSFKTIGSSLKSSKPSMMDSGRLITRRVVGNATRTSSQGARAK